jgi:hypothetical protein
MKSGDKVLIEAMISGMAGDWVTVRISTNTGPHCVTVLKSEVTELPNMTAEQREVLDQAEERG